MKTHDGTIRKSVYLLVALTVSAVLAACGGGGSSVSSGGTGSAAVGISVASTSDFPAGTAFRASTAAPDTSAPPTQPSFDNVFVTVTKIALLPTAGPEGPDRDGETAMPNDPAEEGHGGMRGFQTVVLPSPVVIDLLHPPTGRQVARILNNFPEVPAGEYSKIRVYYESVVGVRAGVPDTMFHPTAHYHFDVHFVGGNLVVPESTDPQGGIRFFSIAINVVGLKYKGTGNGKFLLRPQVFATVEAPKYLVHGVADRVDRTAGAFDILTPGGRIVPAMFDSLTGWALVDQWVVTHFSFPGPLALRDTAIVDVIGVFRGGVLEADEVDITFPDAKTGTVVNGWRADNTFVVRTAADNVTVFPMPDRRFAYYDDNTAVTHDPLSPAAIDNNVVVNARGYAVPGGIEAFWISAVPRRILLLRPGYGF